MNFIPTKNKKASNLSFGFIITGIILAAVSGFLVYSWLFQLIGVLISVAGIQILVRFVLTDFKYCIDDLDDGNSDFIVFKKEGRRDLKVCHISLSTAEKVIGSDKKEMTVSKRYNYVQNIGSPSASIIFLDGDSYIEVIIEYDERFISELKKRIGVGDGGISFAM